MPNNQQIINKDLLITDDEVSESKPNSISPEQEAFLLKEIKLINEMKSLKKKLEEEVEPLNFKIEKQSSQVLSDKEYEAYVKLSEKLKTKKYKIQFLDVVIKNYKQVGRTEDLFMPLSDCVKEMAKTFGADIRSDIIAGTFSRVKSLMKKMLGSSRAVDAVFALQKKDLTGLVGDALLLAKLENLKIDLNNEMHSVLPILNKERKSLKHKFIKTLLNNYYSAKKDDPDVKLYSCYAAVKDNFTEDQIKMINAGKNSRVADLLLILEREALYYNIHYAPIDYSKMP